MAGYGLPVRRPGNASAPAAGPVPGVYTPIAAQSPTGDAATSEVAHWVFTNIQSWLGWITSKAGGAGFITEFGIPSATPGSLYWAEVADQWLTLIDNAGIGVSQWVGGGAHNSSALMQGMTDSTNNGVADTIDQTLLPLLRHKNAGVRSIGLGVVAGSSPPATFCAANPVGQFLPTAGTLAYVAALGIKTVRIQFRWELIQPTRGAALNAAFLQQVADLVTAAGTLGLKCILDLHNYATYIDGTAGAPVQHHLGDGNLTVAQLVDVWTRLSTAFRGNPNVYAYEIMNEPTGMPGGNYATTTSGTGTITSGATITVASTAAFGTVGATVPVQIVASGGTQPIVVTIASSTTFTVIDAAGFIYNQTWANGAAITSPSMSWQDASQSVVTAIRGNADTTLLLISGYDFQAASRWIYNHPSAWITDTASNFLYTAHNYWSSGGSAQGGDAGYGYTWAQELANCQSLGYLRLPGAYPFCSPLLAAASPGGEFLLDRASVSTHTSAVQDGIPIATTFQARRSEAVNFVRVTTEGTAIAGTFTYIGVGIYEMSASKNFKLLAQSANLVSGTTPTVLTVTFTKYKIALGSTFYKRAGVMYAVALLVKQTGTGNTFPTLKGSNDITDGDIWPYPARQLGSALSALPSLVLAPVTTEAFTAFQAYLSPA